MDKKNDLEQVVSFTSPRRRGVSYLQNISHEAEDLASVMTSGGKRDHAFKE